MQRYALCTRLQAGKYEEYKRLHADVWPGVLEAIRQCNIRNYSIYYKDGLLFSYFEYHGNDFEADMAKMSANPICAEWSQLCRPCLEPLPPEWWTPTMMEELFHTE